MAAYSREEVPVEFSQDGVGEVRKTDGGGMSLSFERWAAGLDATEMFAELPGGACQEEHWGYVLKGSGRIRYTDGREDDMIRAGQAYYLPPGHIPMADAGDDLELIEFTPCEK